MEEEKNLSDKKKRGRPAKGNDNRVTLRLSFDEYIKIVQYGKDNNLLDGNGVVNLSEAIRKMIDTYPSRSSMANELVQVEVSSELKDILETVSDISGDSVSQIVIRHIKQSVLHDIEALASGLFLSKKKVSKKKYYELANECEQLTGLTKNEWLLKKEPSDDEGTICMYREMGKNSMGMYANILLTDYMNERIDGDI